jgi:serine protease Do
MKKWNEEDFDQYINGKMDSFTKDSFEREMAGNESLKAMFEAHRETVHLIKRSFERKRLKTKLKHIHQDAFYGHPVFSPNRSTRRARIMFLSGSLAAAASVAVLITFGIIYLSGGFNMDSKDAYVELRNEVQDISSSQESIKQEIRKNNQQPVLFTGTSFAVSSDGLLATNYHVIRGLDSVWVSNYCDTLVRYTATIVYRNAKQDIALLKIVDPAFRGFGKLPYSRSSNGAAMGEYVFTLGYSKQDIVFGEGSISSVSGFNSDTTAYQVSIPVNPGNSGGPLFDAQGNLLGMVSGKNFMKDGVGFAIKSDYIFNAISEISTDDGISQPVLMFKNRIQGKKRPDQLKVIQPLVFRVQIAR